MTRRLGSTKSLFIGVLLILVSGHALSASVSVVPGSMDLGTVERGETVEKTVYVRAADIDETFSVEPSTYPDSENDLFSEDNPNRFEISEQPFGSWVDLEEVEIDPSNEKTIELSNGNLAPVNGNFTFTLEVPDDPEEAEPGLRQGIVKLNPTLSGSGSGAGARVIGATTMQYSFRVPGEVERQITVQEVQGFRQDEDEAAVEVLLRNTGTVTSSVENFNVEILDQRGNDVGTIAVSGGDLAPGESEWMEGYWTKQSGIEEGTYRIDGSVNYMTGSATATGSFSLPGFDVVEVRPEENEGGESSSPDSGGVPIWFVVIVLAILGVLMWGFEIEPFWIVTVLGVIGISVFILMSGLPNFLLAVLLIMVGIIVYGGM